MRSRKELANTLRILAMDAVEQAKSGHPGAPMGMADMAEALWRGALRHNPANPKWADRDRFVLSNGHASMLLYGLLHLTGYDLTMDDLRAFRQLGSRTPGHPEYGVTPGVETTTGPLGQGLATAVGMALAEKLLSVEFNREGYPVVNHFTYAFVGDGCLMEGLSQEACSLAGTLGLGKLIVLYDDNGISIDGKVRQWFADDTPSRFEACGWHVIRGLDGHDGDTLDAAITLARGQLDKPTLICCKTIIGYGAPNKSGTASCHGSALGASEATATRILLGWDDEPFVVPQDMLDDWSCLAKGAALETAWDTLFAQYRDEYPDLAAAFERRMAGTLPDDWESVITSAITQMDTDKPTLATRIANRDVLNILAPHMPELFGGSADLSGSVGTWHERSVRVGCENWDGNYLSYGVREFLMGAMLNGIALHGGFIPYGGTFLVFSDYARNAIRLSALMKQRLVWVLTHDSIGLGEDGPTHQPVEHVSSLRLIPQLAVWRPCDGVETAVAWKSAMEAHGPTCLALSRQALAPQTRTAEQL
ncbi:MAG: transketolase, partial [Bilophila sp.]